MQERVKKELIVRSLPSLSSLDLPLSCTLADGRSRHCTQRVGSYPKFLGGVDVSLIGKEEARLKELAEEGASASLSLIPLDPLPVARP